MKKQIFYALSLFLIFSVGLQAQAQTIHFIGVFESGAPGSERDKETMQEELARIERATSMHINKRLFSKYDTREFRNYINRLSAGSDDVVWFYYSGHGRNSGNGWPAFGSGQEVTKINRIHDKMKQKGARLAITMFDCCNGGDNVTPISGSRTSGDALMYTWLFKKSYGDVKACSSRGTLLSHGNSDIGGAFTSSFLTQIGELRVTKPEANQIWDRLAEATQKATDELCDKQNWDRQYPQFDVNISEVDAGEYTNAPECFNLPYSMSPTELQRYCQETYPKQCRGLSLEQLVTWNHGQRYYYGQRYFNTANLRNNSRIASGTLIWLIVPPQKSPNW